ncbi:MAG: hypothetical protein Q4D94_12455 [Bacillota bacterium]|nr:hypothetical protein [Bacillota bacterium]
MKDKEIKNLFLQADKQIPVNEIRKHQTYEALTEEMNNQRIPVISKKNILLSQFWYMDKLFFIIYGVLICFGFMAITALQYMGVGKNEMVVTCMIGAGILSTVSISSINKLFFGKMAEVGASCYFNTKQCIAAYLVVAGAINFVILTFMVMYLECYWHASLLRMGLYVITPYLTSSMIALGVLSTEIGGRTSYLSGICTFFLSIGYAVISSIPGVLLASSLWIWGIAFAIAGTLFIIQLKKLFRQMEKGEVLCMN